MTGETFFHGHYGMRLLLWSIGNNIRWKYFFFKYNYCQKGPLFDLFLTPSHPVMIIVFFVNRLPIDQSLILAQTFKHHMLISNMVS